MSGSKLDRATILSLLEEERGLIIDRFREANAITEPLPPDHGVRWYLDISKQWAIHHLAELGTVTPGRLLDIGAYYGLIAGVAHRIGWNLAAVDAFPIPDFSSLKIPERNVECEIYNACTDTLPFPDESFDAIVLSEVLEHLNYSPLPMFREIRRVLRPGGILLISTPNPSGLGRLIGLARGRAMMEPHIDIMLAEGETFQHKGLTFFKNNRESKIWTVAEIEKALSLCGLRNTKHFYYGSTIPMELSSTRSRLAARVKSWLLPLFRSWPISGGSLFVRAQRA